MAGRPGAGLRSGDLPPALEAVLAKHRSLIPSLALLIHLADGGSGPVPLSALDKAVGWGRYLFAHAQRIYGSIGADEHAGLVDRIRRRGGAITVRELQQASRAYRTAEAAEQRWQAGNGKTRRVGADPAGPKRWPGGTRFPPVRAVYCLHNP